ncbi:unnamed protein product, partial [Mesorhabditis belari]|uniref:Uncharacterized protein n=1 Tax=Mesorhabditis belari TaxID=2138241 RepID=A0AAF3EU82_9BILA
MLQKTEPHRLACGFVIDSKIPLWAYREEERLLGASLTVNAVECEQDVVYKVRAHGVKDPIEKAKIKTTAKGVVKAGDLEHVFVQFSNESLNSICLTVSVDGVEYPVDIDRNECFFTPKKKVELNIERLGLATPLRAGLSSHPTPMKSLAQSAARVYNSLKPPPSTRSTSLPPSLGRRLVSPRNRRRSQTPIKAPSFEDTITTQSHISVSTTTCGSLPGVTEEHFKRLEELLPRAGTVTTDELWMLTYYFVMDVFVSMGHYSRQWFMSGGPETKFLRHACEKKIFWEPEMTLECLVVTMMIDYLEKHVADLEREDHEEKPADPVNPAELQTTPAVEWFNKL